VQPEQTPHDGYQWTALSVTTVGALLASIQGSALLIALPSILAELHVTSLAIIWALLGYLLILTVFTPVVARLADDRGVKRLYHPHRNLWSSLGYLASPRTRAPAWAPTSRLVREHHLNYRPGRATPGIEYARFSHPTPTCNHRHFCYRHRQPCAIHCHRTPH